MERMYLVAVVVLVLSSALAKRGPKKPWEQEDAGDIKQKVEQDDQKSGYNAAEYGGYATPELYYEKMLTLNAEGGNMKKVKLFLDAGININAKEEEGDTALMKAARAGRRKTVKFLLKRGANPSFTNKLGETALMLSSAGGYKGITKSLLEHKKTEVNAQSSLGETALYKAAANKNRKAGAVALALLKAGADPDTQTLNGWTALHAALESDQSDVVEQLIEYDVDVNYALPEKNNCTALMLSIEQSKSEITHLLLFREATEPSIDVNVADDYGVTPLMYACVKGNLTVVKEMLRVGARVNAKSGWDKDTALHRASFFGHLEVARALLKRGARVTAQNYQLVTPLMKASWYSTPEIVALLLQFGAGTAMEHQSVHGDTALSKTRLWGRIKIVHLLEAEEKRRQAPTDHYEL